MNIAEIAKMAGVSSAAVSRYFNNGYISESKREAIKRVVEETGYRPSVQAQTLRTKKTMLVGVIIPKAASASMGKLVEGILAVLNESGYRMLLAVTQHDPLKELEYLKTFDQKQVDGIILAATVISEEHKKVLSELQVPVIIVGQQVPDYASVYHDDYHASFEMTERVIRSGRKMLGYVGVTEQDYAAGKERYRGFCDALHANGMGEQKSHYVVADFNVEAGYDKIQTLLAAHPEMDSVICATDEIAVGVQQYLKEAGVLEKQNVMVTGHGDSMLARVAYPTIPTIHYFYSESGRQAVMLLLRKLNSSEEEDAPDTKEFRLGYEVVSNGRDL